MSIVIVTTAYLGDKKNLKTAGISPVIDVLSQKGKLKQVICQVYKNFHFQNTFSSAPLLYRYAVRLLENIFGISLKKFRKLCQDLITSWRLQKADVTIFHPAGSFEQSITRAKKKGSIAVGISTVAHPKYEEALFREEYKKFGAEFKSNGRFDKSHTIVNSLDHIIAYSDFVKSSYVQYGFPAERISVAYSDIPLPARVPRRSQDGEFRVLFLAHITPRKGLQYLLEAWDSLHLPDTELVIVGGYGNDAYTPKEFKTYCDDIITRNTNIKWVGGVEDPSSYYRDASLFVFPSLSEGNPKVVMEAMAHGLPVIVTPNAQSIAEDGVSGYVIPVRDADAIEEKIQYLYHHRDVVGKMGDTAREAMEKKSSFGEMVSEICSDVTKKKASCLSCEV